MKRKKRKMKMNKRKRLPRSCLRGSCWVEAVTRMVGTSMQPESSLQLQMKKNDKSK